MYKVVICFAIARSLVLAQGGFEGPGRYEITNLKSGKMLELDRNDQTSVVQFGSRGTDSQRWDIAPAAPGLYYVRNAMNGKALEISRNANKAPLICSDFDGGPNQQWKIEPGKDGNALITSRSGRTIDIPDGSRRDGVRVQIYELNGDSNQRFLLRRAGGARDGGRRDHRAPDASGRFWDERDQTWKLDGDGACFYEQPGFHGDAICARSGASFDELRRDTMIWSVRVFGRVREVNLFERPGFLGRSVRVTRDERDLSRLNARGRVGSIRVN